MELLNILNIREIVFKGFIEFKVIENCISGLMVMVINIINKIKLKWSLKLFEFIIRYIVIIKVLEVIIMIINMYINDILFK